MRGSHSYTSTKTNIIMKRQIITAIGSLVCVSVFAQTDSIASEWDRQMNLNEVVVVGHRPVLKQEEGKLTYLVKNDPYSRGLDGVTLLDRIPRVSVNNGTVNVAGKGNVRYIIDGVLMELSNEAMAARLRNLRAESIEKIELLTTPPARYPVEANAVYISIITRNETLGTRGNMYGSLTQGNDLREYISGSINHTTRKVEMSFDANVSDYNGTNDNDMSYKFPDYTRRSSTHNRVTTLDAGFNAIFRYKFSPDMSIGLITNYNYGNSKVEGTNKTDYDGYGSSSLISTKSRPNNALTVTGFYDWTFGTKGETAELTYNHFNRHSPTLSEINTTYDSDRGDYVIDEHGTTDYRFNSGKADIKLPLPWAKLETGVAYTDILNSSLLSTSYGNRAPDNKIAENNDFDYRERIAAAYISASRGLGKGFWGKMGLRYEYTWTKGELLHTSEISRNNYGRLFPSINLSWNKAGIGTFNLSYSMGMGRPNLWEINPFRFYSTTDEYAAGNPELKPTIYNNAEINYYGLGGLYAVLYTSFASDAIGYLRRLDTASGTISTQPYNCMTTNKTGLYASYRRNLYDWWEMSLGGEAFHTYSHGKLDDFKTPTAKDWSGKIEIRGNWMLNRQKTLTFNASFTHFFPWMQNMVEYKSLQLINFTLRYALLNNRLNLRLTANDIFGWNKTRSTERYSSYTLNHTYDPHNGYVLLGIGYTFGRDKVNRVWRSSKEDQSSRTK